MPNFLVIGAAKSATTSLHEYLHQHPDIYMSPVKEPNFLAFDGPTPAFRGPPPDQLGNKRPLRAQLRNARYELSISNLHDYQKLFSRVAMERAIGESSVSYMYAPEAPARIKAYLPNVRLIAVLRHPADRAYSKYMQFQRDGLEPIGEFSKALDAEDERIRQHWSPTWHYKHRGFYYRQLNRYYEIFDRKQIKVFLYDDLSTTPITVMQEIFQFLDVDDRFVPDLTERYNVTGSTFRAPKSRLLDSLLNTRNPLRSAANTLLPRSVVRNLRTRIVHYAAGTAPTRSYAPMPGLVRARLIDEYKTDILRLQQLIDRDVSHWLQDPPVTGAPSANGREQR